ncbi:hypothetical protein HOLleu_32773 [Holothuria leucospilota]|uniref:Integrase core domain-containing protein n=1 Tax=Holothuria leucospilota TaxID=206669 RepID=A0A9Q1BJ87_HOLLE|nr:hypothetical protein HOLleu_32773 [Holothuria leucospilota]
MTQETTRLPLNALGTDGVALRRSRRIIRRRYRYARPNYLIHTDGYNKQKQYGFAVHAAIDGFSRKVLWLCVGNSKNNPRMLAKLFIDYVKRIGGVPKIVRADRGTENVFLRHLQIALRSYHDSLYISCVLCLNVTW